MYLTRHSLDSQLVKPYILHISNICALVRLQHRSVGLMIRGEEIEYSALMTCNLQEFSNSLAFNSLDVCVRLIVYLFPRR